MSTDKRILNFARFKSTCPKSSKVHPVGGTVDKINTCRAIVCVGPLLVNRNHTETRPGKKIALDTQHRIVRPVDINRLCIIRGICRILIRENIQDPYAEAADFTRNFSTCQNRDSVSCFNTDAATIEKEERRRCIETRPWNAKIE